MLNALQRLCDMPRRMTRLGFALPSILCSRASKEHMPMTQRPKVLVITGPTAVGKSATALKLCKLLDGEIVSADSVQVYKNLDIGSNKASPEELAEVRHHMLNIADPAVDEFSAGDFFRVARIAIEDIHSRNRLPVVVGGTMMYVRWLIYGRPATPRAPQHAREKVESIVKSFDSDWDSAIAYLAERDPKRAEQLSKNDWYRLGRALEVLETTGTAMTDMPLQGGAPNADVDPDRLDYDFRCMFLFGDRLLLNRRIDERCEEMILPRTDVDEEAEWDELSGKSVLHEITSLLLSQGLRVAPASPSRAIGYRQAILYLVGRALSLRSTQKDADHRAECNTDITDSVEEFRRFIGHFQSATRGYAKQQVAWFRKEQQFRWVRAGPGALEEIHDVMRLSRPEYEELRNETEEKQKQVRSNMMAQGKQMKTYIGERVWIKEGSIAEVQAVRLAERCANAMAQSMSAEELQQIREVLTG